MSTLQKESSVLDVATQEPWLATTSRLYREGQKEIKKSLKTAGTFSRRKINVCGFDLLIADETETIAFRKKIVKEAEATKALKEELKEKGINPIAILPKDIFGKLIEKSNFYSFHNIASDGSVPAKAKNYIQTLSMSGSEKWDWKIFLLLGHFITTVVMCLVGFFSFKNNLVGFIFAGSSFLQLLSMFIQLGNNLEIKNWHRILYYFGAPLVGLIRFWHRRIVKPRLRTLLWPQKNNLGFDPKKDGSVKITLPEPPDSIKAKLEQCFRSNLSTFLVVHNSAFTVVMDHETEDMLRQKYADPIICHQSGDLVAVIDQFGDFPEEKEVVRYISEHFDAIRKDFQISQVN